MSTHVTDELVLSSPGRLIKVSRVRHVEEEETIINGNV